MQLRNIIPAKSNSCEILVEVAIAEINSHKILGIAQVAKLILAKCSGKNSRKLIPAKTSSLR